MSADEHFYGFGFMRSAFDARGKVLTWKRVYRWNEATVPFFMSTRNYAFYSNNTFDHVFDFRSLSEDVSRQEYMVTNTGGVTDFYWLVGDGMKSLLKTYSDLTGHSEVRTLIRFGWELMGLLLLRREVGR